MKIFPLQTNLYSNNKIQNRKSLYSFALPKDTISFSAKAIPNNVIKKAKKFGQELFSSCRCGQLDENFVQNLAKKNIPFLCIDRISNLPEGLSKQDYNAYLLPAYNQECKLEKLTIFMPDGKIKPETIGSIVHEYTHALQRYNDDNYMGLADIVDGNIEKARALNAFCTVLFGKLEKLKDSKMSFVTFSKILKGINEDRAFQIALNSKNNAQTNEIIQEKFFKQLFDETYNEFASEAEAFEYIPLLKDVSKLRQIAKKQCALRANMELEANIAQKEILQEIGEKVSAINIVSIPFYRAIASALN